MASLRISELTEEVTPSSTDYVEIIVSPFTPGTNRKVQLGNLPASGSTDFSRHAAAVLAGTLTLDMDSEQVRNFDLTLTISSNFTIAFSNDTNMVEASLTLRVTGAITLTMPAAVQMQSYETINGRWNTSTNVLTLTGTTATRFLIEFYDDGTAILTTASDPFE
jgi:hypothetical protein